MKWIIGILLEKIIFYISGALVQWWLEYRKKEAVKKIDEESSEALELSNKEDENSRLEGNQKSEEVFNNLN